MQDVSVCKTLFSFASSSLVASGSHTCMLRHSCLLCTVKNRVFYLHLYGCSNCHEHQAHLGVYSNTLAVFSNTHACVNIAPMQSGCHTHRG